MTRVFFLFLLHATLGLLAMLPVVPSVAGRSFFKFCSGAAAVLATWALGLLLHRYGFHPGSDAPGGAGYGLLVTAVAVLLGASILYNRAWHFAWRGTAALSMSLALLAGTLGIVTTAVASGSPLLTAASGASSALLLGSAAAAMILGHFYLVVVDMPISALRRLTVILVAALLLRALLVGAALLGPFHAGLDDAGAVAMGLMSLDGVFVWMRLLFGIAAPLSLIWFIWKTVEIRSTQSATGILYVQLFLIMAGELLACYLRVVARLPL